MLTETRIISSATTKRGKHRGLEWLLEHEAHERPRAADAEHDPDEAAERAEQEILREHDAPDLTLASRRAP